MNKQMRPELSIRNKYYINKHRHYELKHFCLQYPDWKRSYNELDSFGKLGDGEVIFSKSSGPSDPTAKTVEKRLKYLRKMELIEQAAIDTDPDLASYIIKGVTEGLSYTALKSRLEIPCSRDTYYNRYRRFFWLLNKTRDYYI